MPLEIERKFLLSSDTWKKDVHQSYALRQGYLNSNPDRTVRVRIRGERGFLTMKGRGNGISRPEFEYDIPYEEALALLTLCEQPIIEKTRHEVRVGEHLWEVDVFEGENAGLVVAEIELSEEDEAFERPTWLGKEVSDDRRYFNSSLIRKPFRKW